MQRFPKNARITCADEFRRVKDEGVRFRSSRITVAAASGNRRRLGVAVSRRVGNAAQRNRIKRVIKEAFRCNQGSFPCGDCVVVAHAGAAKQDNNSIRRALTLALSGFSAHGGEGCSEKE